MNTPRLRRGGGMASSSDLLFYLYWYSYNILIAFVMYITTTMCDDGVLHCLWFDSNVFLVSLHGD